MPEHSTPDHGPYHTRSHAARIVSALRYAAGPTATEEHIAEDVVRAALTAAGVVISGYEDAVLERLCDTRMNRYIDGPDALLIAGWIRRAASDALDDPDAAEIDEEPMHGIGDLAEALGGSETSFTGKLLLLIAKADPDNRERLRTAYPRHVLAWEIWMAAAPTPTAAELLAKLPAQATPSVRHVLLNALRRDDDGVTLTALAEELTADRDDIRASELAAADQIDRLLAILRRHDGEFAALTAERDQARRELDTIRPIITAVRAWREAFIKANADFQEVEDALLAASDRLEDDGPALERQGTPSPPIPPC